MQEVWKDIVNYEGIYQVSNLGNVRRIYKNKTKILKPSNRLYYDVDLSKKCNHKRQAIHRLVALHFVPNPNPKVCVEVNHKDGNKHNNNADNLEWVSQQQNALHSQVVLKNYAFGKPPIAVKKIDSETNEIIEVFPSISSASKSVGKSNANVGIRNVCNGYQAKAYGYKWEYAD